MRTALIALVTLLIGAAPGWSPAAAAETPPDVLVRDVTNDVLTIVRQDKEIQSGSTQRAIELVEAKVLPHFNFRRMTVLAVGRDWRQASPAQQATLTEEFQKLLVRTYSNALTAYKNQVVEFKPFRMKPADDDVTVRTQVNQPGLKPIDIDYSLEKNDAGGWKVYDVTVAGVSLVTNYRDSFSAEVRKGGIEGLIASLKSKNRANVEAAAQSAAKK